jgi:hypothetical protein
MPVTSPKEYLGNSGFIGVAPELSTAYGTPVSATSWVPFKSETLAGKPGFKNVPTIRQTRSEYTTKFAGLYDIGGDIVLPMYPTSGMIFFAAALGKDAYATTTHTLTVSEAGLPSLTIEKNLAGVTDSGLSGPASIQMAGMVVSKYAAKLTVGAEAEATVTFLGQQDAYIAPSTPTFLTDTTPYSLLQISATIAAAAAPFITAIDLTIDNGAKALGTLQGSRYAALVYGGARKVEGKITTTMQDTGYLKTAFAGTYQPMVISLIQDGTHSLVITLPNVLLGDLLQPIKMGEVMMQEIPFTAYDIPGSTDISAVMKNDIAAVYFT